MKHKISQAVEANDIVQVRSLMIEMMEKRAGHPKTLLEISETVAKLPGLFEPDDGKSYPPASEITETHLAALAEDLRGNFSLTKYRLFTEVHARIVRDPNYSLKEESTSGEISSMEGSLAQNSMDGISSLTGTTQPVAKSSKTLKTIGYVLMILGLACSIVGLCVPVSFMIGLGIGVLMLGSAVVYSAIPRNQ